MGTINLTTLFTQLGRVVYWSNALTADQNTIYLEPTNGMADDLLSVYNANRALVPNFQGQCQGFASAMAGQVAAVQSIATVTLASLQGALNAPNNNPSTIIPLLSQYMVANAATVQANVPAAVPIFFNPIVTASVSTGLVTADTYSQAGTHANFPYYASQTLVAPILLWCNAAGTVWTFSLASGGVGVHGTDYFTSATGDIRSAYTAHGGAGGVAPVITEGNTTNDVLVTSFLNNQGVNDQRITSGETVVITCTSSQYSGGTAGSEQWAIVGQPVISPAVYGQQGNGTASMTTIDASNVVQNGNFETWSGSPLAATNWSPTPSGAFGTNIIQSTTQQHSGSACAEFIGNATAPTTISLTQTIASSIQSQTVYAASVWLKKGSGTFNSGSNLAVSITGTGFSTVYLVGASPFDPSSVLTTSYQQFVIFFTVPNTTGNGVPIDLSVNIAWSSVNSAGVSAQIYVDDLVIARPTNFGNLQLAIFRGSVDPVVGDQFQYGTSLTTTGAFQDFFALWYNQELNSTTGSATISDSLATSLP